MTIFNLKLSIYRFLKRLFIIIILIILILLITLGLIQKNPKKLDINRIKIIDNIGSNYLLRGSNPYVNIYGKSIFSYHDLKNNINQRFNQEDKPSLSKFYLIDLNLLDIDAFFQIQEEQDFFNKNPQLGSFRNFSEISLNLLLMPLSSNNFLNKITDNYHDKLTKVLIEVNQILANQQKNPVIIYVHCNAGRDRTGLFFASYRMLFKKNNLNEVIQKNIDEVNRNAEYLLADTIESYCYYLKRKFPQTHGNIECKTDNYQDSQHQ